MYGMIPENLQHKRPLQTSNTSLISIHVYCVFLSLYTTGAPHTNTARKWHICTPTNKQVTLAQRDMLANKLRKFQKHVCIPAAGKPMRAMPHPVEMPDALLHAPAPSGVWSMCFWFVILCLCMLRHALPSMLRHASPSLLRHASPSAAA